MASESATSKDAVIKQIDDLLTDIFEKHSVPSQYQRNIDGKNQCLRFPEADEDWWECCRKNTDSINQAMVLIESHEIDDDLQVGIKSIEYYLNLEIIRQNFVMFMKPCQEKFREARKRLSHLVGTIEVLTLESSEPTQKQRELVEKRFITVGEQIHEAAYLLECCKIWSIKS